MASAEVASQQPPHKETFHVINHPTDAINEALTGLTLANPYLSYDKTHKIVYRSDIKSIRDTKVTVVGFSGGGHEPMFAGFVGPSFLSAYVSGNIFASPTAAQILRAVQFCQPAPGPSNPSPGTLVVCGNYTGDILNAGLAITRAQALGYKVRFVPVGDDVAVGREKGGKVGRRGLCGHLVGLKIACALAEEGKCLEEIGDTIAYVAENVGTIGVAFDRVSLPTGSIAPLPMLPADTIELGMGAHGEPGLQQISPPPSPEELIPRMISLITDTTDKDRAFVPFTSSDNAVVLLLNSLGSTSDVALARFSELAADELKRKGFDVKRLILGPMVTSLKMSGFGITLWRLPQDADEKISRQTALDLWDKKTQCAAWRQ